jgi:hypothetical protein
MPLLSKRARRDQVVSELDRLRQELQRWYEDRTAADRHQDGSPRGQYHSQLQAIWSEVSGAAQLLATDLENLNLGENVAALYQRCASNEKQIYWLWRVWYFFRDKFDQREDCRFRGVLRAADEVVWSCYRPFFELPGFENRRPPAPLPYIEPAFSPSALRRDQRQVLDRKEQDFLLVKKAFAELPVPLIKIPITSVHNPWALVLIGHEIGHIIEPLLEENFNRTFAEAIGGSVELAGGSKEDAIAWNGWADEIFADLYCILTMGNWAVWAMAQFEASTPEIMSRRRIVYPAPYARLELMRTLANRLHVPTEPFELRPDGSPELQRDLKLGQSVADAILALPKIGELAAALPFEPSAYATNGAGAKPAEVEHWACYLQGLAASPISNKVRSARMVTAGGAQVWSQTIYVEDFPQAVDQSQALATKIIARITEAAAPGVRSAVGQARKRELGHALMAALAEIDAGPE